MPRSSHDDPQESAKRQRVFWNRVGQGLALGTLASSVAWIPGWTLFFEFGGTPLLLAPLCLKVLIATVCLSKSRWRGYGLGILLSIPIGLLIFFGSCAVHVAKL